MLRVVLSPVICYFLLAQHVTGPGDSGDSRATAHRAIYLILPLPSPAVRGREEWEEKYIEKGVPLFMGLARISWNAEHFS